MVCAKYPKALSKNAKADRKFKSMTNFQHFIYFSFIFKDQDILNAIKPAIPEVKSQQSAAISTASPFSKSYTPNKSKNPLTVNNRDPIAKLIVSMKYQGDFFEASINN